MDDSEVPSDNSYTFPDDHPANVAGHVPAFGGAGTGQPASSNSFVRATSGHTGLAAQITAVHHDQWVRARHRAW